MHVFKILATAAVAAAFAGQALAQCSHLGNTPPGANLSLTDDSTRLVGLPFAFPFDGTSFTQMQICSNGFVTLGATSSTDNSPTEAELATAIGRRIAPLWWDLNPASSQTLAGGGVFYNASATQVNVCWHNVAQFGTAAGQPIGDFELIMMASGDIYFNYGTTNGVPTLATVIGIGRGAAANPIVPVNGTGGVGWAINYPSLYTNPETTTATVSQAFAASALNTNNLNGAGLGTILWLSPSAPGTYNVTGLAALPTCAPNPTLAATTSTIVGTACSSPATINSICELWTVNTGTNPLDVSGTSIKFTKSGTSYVSGPGIGYDSSYTATTGTAYTDDQTVTGLSVGPMGSYTLGGTTYTQVSVNANGYIWMGTNTSTAFSPSLSAFATGGARVAAFFTDLLPSGTSPGTGLVYYNTGIDYLGTGLAYAQATWENVQERSNAGTSVNCQVTLTSNGDAYVAYGTCTAGVTHTTMAGISGGTGATPTSSNLITAGVANVVGPVNLVNGGFTAMSHTVTLAALGQNFTMTSSVPSNHAGIGILGIGFTNPALPLDAIFGTGTAPGCTLYTDAAQDLLFPVPITANATTFSLTVYAPIPVLFYLQGITAFSQAAAAGPWNAAGVISSNGRTFSVGF